MANKNARKQEIMTANRRKYDAAKKKLRLWQPVTAAVLATALLCVFVPFIEIYNNPAAPGAFDPESNGGRPFIELSAGGWQCLIIALTGDYTSAQSKLAAFYYWVAQQGGQPYVTMLAVSSLVAVSGVIVSMAMQAVMFFTKAHRLGIIALAADVIAALAFALAFVSALMCSAEMLAGYCNNNPACSIRSFAIIPALAAVAAAVLDFVHMFKSAGVEKAQA